MEMWVWAWAWAWKVGFFCGLWAFGLVSLGWVNTNVFEWVWILGLQKTEVFNKVSLIQTQQVPQRDRYEGQWPRIGRKLLGTPGAVR